MDPLDLRGRWVFVTGGARRVGRAIVHAFAVAGANLVLHHHTSAAAAAEVVEECRRLGRDALSLRADLADARAVRDLADEVERRTGGVTVLVNNASNYLRTPWSDLDEDVWDLSMSVNLKAPYLLSLRIGEGMRRRQGGAIVNLVDCSAERPYRSYLPYSVSKAGLICLTRCLARELAPNVRVNAVAPGPVLLPEGTAEREREAIGRATPLGLGTPEEVAHTVRFLAVDATYTTGSIVHVDGGRAIA